MTHYHRNVIFNGKKMKLREAIDSAPVAGTKTVNVPAKPGRPEREAELNYKLLKLTIPPSVTGDSKINIEMNCVYAVEVNDGVKDPIRWALLTTLPVKNVDSDSDRKVDRDCDNNLDKCGDKNGGEDCVENGDKNGGEDCGKNGDEDFVDPLGLIDVYTLRWIIEEYHRVLKSTCNVEKLQFRSLNSLLPAIALTCVTAWRVLHLSKFSRVRGDEDAEKVASPLEREALDSWHAERRKRYKPIKTVHDFVIAVAILGGFLARKCDREPGPKPIWRGLMKLESLTAGYRMASKKYGKKQFEKHGKEQSGQSEVNQNSP